MTTLAKESWQLETVMPGLFQALGDKRDYMIRRLESDPEFAMQVANFMLTGISLSTHDKARAIMGDNFFGVEVVQQFLNIVLTPEQLEAVKHIPYSKETLLRYRKSHFLVLGVPRSNYMKHSRFTMNCFLKEYPPDDIKLGWYLISRRIDMKLHNSDLPEGKRLPTWNEAMYAYILKNLADRNVYPLRDTLGLCQEAVGKDKVYIGMILYKVVTCRTLGSIRQNVQVGALSVIMPDQE